MRTLILTSPIYKDNTFKSNYKNVCITYNYNVYIKLEYNAGELVIVIHFVTCYALRNLYSSFFNHVILVRVIRLYNEHISRHVGFSYGM